MVDIPAAAHQRIFPFYSKGIGEIRVGRIDLAMGGISSSPAGSMKILSEL